MSFQRFCGIVLACLLLFSSGSLAEEEPVVIRVGKVEYPLSVVQFALDPYFDLAAAQEQTMTPEERQELAEMVVERLVGVAVIENKLAETGNAEFTEEETEILTAEARRQYDQTWQQIYRDTKEYAPEVTEREVTDWLTEKGYTVKAFLRELMTNERESRILDLYCADVTVTPEEVQNFYREMYLDPDRERYENDIPLYEEEILEAGNESFYAPEGYRTLKNIQLDYPERIRSELGTISLNGKKAVSEAQKAYSALAAAAAAGEDTASLKETYDQKMEVVRAWEAKYQAKEEEAIPLLQETIDAIRAELQAGIGIDTLLKKYSTDQSQTGSDRLGALYHPKSTRWSEAAHRAIGAMSQPGELSEPFADEDGVHLAYYVSDQEGGPRLLTVEENELLNNTALLYAKRVKLADLVEKWKEEYEVFTDISRLRLE